MMIGWSLDWVGSGFFWMLACHPRTNQSSLDVEILDPIRSNYNRISVDGRFKLNWLTLCTPPMDIHFFDSFETFHFGTKKISSCTELRC